MRDQHTVIEGLTVSAFEPEASDQVGAGVEAGVCDDDEWTHLARH